MRLRVLIADDTSEGADMLADLLRAAGHSVRVEYDGAAAAEAASVETFDVAVLDITMPLLDGWDLAAAIHARTPQTLLFAISGTAGEEDLRKSREAGFTRHFRKPVSFLQLRDLIESQAALQRAA